MVWKENLILSMTSHIVHFILYNHFLFLCLADNMMSYNNMSILNYLIMIRKGIRKNTYLPPPLDQSVDMVVQGQIEAEKGDQTHDPYEPKGYHLGAIERGNNESGSSIL